MTPRYPSFVALAGITAVLCFQSVRSEEPSSPTAPPRSSTSALTDLETAAPKDWKDPATIAAHHARVITLIETNTLQSGEDYRRAAALLNIHRNEYRIGRLGYELLLT